MPTPLALFSPVLRSPWARVLIAAAPPLALLAIVLVDAPAAAQMGLPLALTALLSLGLIGLAAAAPVEASISYGLILALTAWHPELRNVVTFFGGTVLLAVVATKVRPWVTAVIAAGLTFVGTVEIADRHYAPTSVADVISVLLFLSLGAVFGIVYQEARRRYLAREREMEQALEDERDRTARALHSSVAASLTSVIMRSEVLALDQRIDRAMREDASRIADDARRAMEEVRDLIRFVASGAVDRPAEGDSSVGDDLARFMRELRDHGFRTQVRGDVDVVDDAASPPQLNVALRELGTNITKYGESSEPVVVSVRHGHGRIRIETRNLISARQTRRHMSTGLGLDDVRRILSHAGGSYRHTTVRNRWRNQLTLPMSD